MVNPHRISSLLGAVNLFGGNVSDADTSGKPELLIEVKVENAQIVMTCDLTLHVMRLSINNHQHYPYYKVEGL
jgi:hypothetical protein